MTNYQFNQEQLLDEAEAWIVRLRSDNLSEEDKRRFSEWLNTSAMHIDAFDEASAIWEKTGAINYLPTESIDNALDDRRTTLDKWREALGECFAKVSGAPIYLTSFCLITLFVSTLYLHHHSDQPAEPRLFESAVGQTKNIELEDGSQLELNTNTKILVNYTKKSRQITLVQGEAFFQVARDKQRPFSVNFGKGTATALGTAFNIFKQSGLSSVTVSEGVVAVREPVDLVTPEPVATKLYADQQVYVSRRGIGPVKHVDSSRNTSWREGTIEFKNTPLKLALEELNRYLKTPVDISASEVNDLNVTGTFSLHNPITTLNALSTAFSLQQHLSGESDTLYLRSSM